MKALYLRLCALGFGLVGPLAAQVSVPPTPGPVAVIPQVADGGAWQTTLVLTNPNTEAALVSLEFYQSTGGGATQSWNLPLLETSTKQELTLPPGGTLFLHTPGTGPTTTVGWGQVLSFWTISCYAIFTQRVSGRPDQNGTAEGVSSYSHLLVPFDNTGGLVTSLAVANSSLSSAAIYVTFQSTDGAVSHLPPISIPALGQMTFALPQQFPSTSAKGGLLEFYAPTGAISASALRFNPGGAFTASPVYQDDGTPIIGALSAPKPPVSVVTSLLTFQPKGLPSSQIPLVLRLPAYGAAAAQLSTLPLPNGLVSNQTVIFNSPVLAGEDSFLVNGSLLQVTGAILTLTLAYDQTQANPAYPTGKVNGTLTVSAVPLRGGANMTVSGSIAGDFLAH
ncbi:MAG TPA: hypothetical protein VLY24_07005 [Bryobacteraceae bacterium]|nr:hypothetical protein [Bryobacteraceae bacterium]